MLATDKERGPRLRHGFYADIGSVFDDAAEPGDLNPELMEYTNWCRTHLRGNHDVHIENENVMRNGKLVDVRVWLVISFDLSGDAMLSRMTWPSLKRYPEHAKRRRRSRSSC